MPPAPKRTIIEPSREGLPEVVMLGRYDYASAGAALGAHDHPGCMEICYLLRGRQQYRVGGTDYLLRGGDVFLTYPDERHGTGGAPEEKGVLYWCILRWPAKGGTFLGCDGRGARAMAKAFGRLGARHFLGEPGIGRAFDSAMRAMAQPRTSLWQIHARHHLLDACLRVLACGESSARPRVSPAVAQAVHAAERHVAEPLPLRALAREAGLSLPRFKARFKAETGVPPSEYQMRCRIEAARGLLRSGRRSVTDVAFALGFRSSQYFATAFRRYTGTTPSAYAEAAAR